MADAASLHLEWIYDQNKVNKIVSAEEKDPAFWEEDHCPFFSLPNGKVSCYADQAIQSLTVLLLIQFPHQIRSEIILKVWTKN